MKKFIIVLILLFSFITLTFSQDEFGMMPGPNFNETKVLVYNKSDVLFAGTWGAGIKKSTDDATSWTSVNTGLTNLHITDIKVGPNNELFASTFGGGVFKSTDSGLNWTSVSVGLTNMIVKCLYVHTKDTIICGTYGDGVFISTNSGNTWNQSFSGLNYRDINCLIVNTRNVIFAGTYGNGVYTSNDFGKSWVRSNGGVTSQFINGFFIARGTAVSCYTNGKAIFESDNDGKAWAELLLPEDNTMIDNNFACVAVNKNSNNKDLVVGTRSQGIWVYKRVAYDDYVRNFQTRGGVGAIAQRTNGTMVAFSSADGYLRSTDGFWTYENLTSNPLNTQPTYMVYPFLNNLVYSCNELGGLFKSNDNGTTFSNVAGFESKIVSDVYVGNKHYAAASDGLYISTNGTSWNQYLAGDTIVSVYEGGTNGSRIMAVKATQKSVEITDPMGNKKIVKMVITKIIKSDNQGLNWDTLNTEYSSGSVIIKSINKNAIAFGGYSGFDIKILRSNDNCINFSNYSITPYQNSSIVDFSIDKNNSLITVNSAGVQFYTSGNTLIKNDTLRFLFPNTTKTCSNSQVEIFNDDTVYVGSLNNNGLYRTGNHGQTWDSLNRAFNVGRINFIQINPDKDVFFTTKALYRNIYPGSMGIPKLKIPLTQSIKISYKNAGFSWDSSKKAELYHYQLSRDSDFTYRDLEVVLAPNSYTISSELLPATKYFWRTRGKNYGSYSEWSNVFSFTTTVVPPILKTPVRYAVGVKNSSTFVWYQTEIASKTFTIQVSEDSLFNKTDFTFKSLDTNLIMKGLKPLTNYWWRVSSELSEGWSTAWKFKTSLPSPQLIFPANNSVKNSININFTWKNVLAANDYFLNVCEDSLFLVNIYNGKTSGLNNQIIEGLNYNKLYYWKVSSKDNEGESEWSQIWSFKTAIQSPQLVAPDSGKANMPTSVIFRWNSIKNATSYHLQVSDKADFSSNLLFNQDTLTDLQQEVKGLSKYTTYYWRVLTKIGEFESPYGNVWNIKTLMDTTKLFEPTNKKQDVPQSIYLEWLPTKGAISYTLQISRNETYTNIMYNDPNIKETKQNIVFPPDSTFYWRVKAKSLEGDNEWSSEWSFKTSKDQNSVIEIGKLKIDIYPNPFNEKVTLQLIGDVSEITELSITNETGNEIMKIDIRKLDSNGISLDTKSFSQGFYFLKIVTKDGAILEKLNCLKK
ncbi:MAG: T9SS type A sorting domain-containing protein [Candidatus Kapabacteria bacterium]|nr:T9SS type A sorting domain-containing protein [Candidatus Kapabacteria bacterium]